MKGRIRSVKPEVHLDEGLWDLEQATGVNVYRIFQGLWNYSDRDGRFEWKVRTLKTLIMPWWDGDFGAAMDALAGAGFIKRYEVDGRTYGLVVNFLKHQRPNPKEEASTIPPPPDTQAQQKTKRENPPEPQDEMKIGTRENPGEDRENTQKGTSGKGMEGNGREQEGKGSPRGARVESAPSASHIAEFREIFATEADAAGWSPPPVPIPDQLRTGAERARSYQAQRGITFADAARAIAQSALQLARAANKSPGLALLDCEPGKTHRRPSRIAAPGTAADFADEDTAAQIARLGGAK